VLGCLGAGEEVISGGEVGVLQHGLVFVLEFRIILDIAQVLVQRSFIRLLTKVVILPQRAPSFLSERLLSDRCQLLSPAYYRPHIQRLQCLLLLFDHFHLNLLHHLFQIGVDFLSVYAHVFEDGKVLLQLPTHSLINNPHISRVPLLLQHLIQQLIKMLAHLQRRRNMVLLRHQIPRQLLSPLILLLQPL
jgi:hypothetical protein